MFGISSLGWIHTLGSLPAIPIALFMLFKYGRIVPRSKLGMAYFISMLIGSLTVFIIAHQPVSYIIGIATFVLLVIGYGIRHVVKQTRIATYIETISLSLTVFLLMVPTVSETLRRVPDGHPIVTDLKDPILLGAQGALFVMLLIGIAIQVILLRRKPVISQ